MGCGKKLFTKMERNEMRGLTLLMAAVLGGYMAIKNPTLADYIIDIVGWAKTFLDSIIAGV